MGQLDPNKARWNGERPPEGSKITGGQMTLRLPDNTRAVVVFEVGEDGTVTYTRVKPDMA